jgi:hypothetical protein
MRTIDSDAQRGRKEQAAALKRSIADTDTKIKRAIRNLELVDDPNPTSFATPSYAAPNSGHTSCTSRPSSPNWSRPPRTRPTPT